MAGFTLKKREFFRHVGTISMFAVVGTIISSVLFGLLTYLLVLLHIVKRKHLGTAPLIECMLYGEPALLCFGDSGLAETLKPKSGGKAPSSACFSEPALLSLGLAISLKP
jgi:hypothetical protein